MRTKSITFATPGSYTWNPPSGITAAWATLVGAGAGGNGWDSTQNGGNAGGAGEYVEAILIPISSSVSVVVGSGGAGGNDVASPSSGRIGSDGTLSSVNGVILALPGYRIGGGSRGDGGGPTGGTGGFEGNPAGLGARLGRHVGGAGGGEGGTSGAPIPHAASAGALAAGIATYSVPGGAGVTGGFGGSGANSEFGPGGDGASGSNLPGAATTYIGAGGGGASTSLSPGGNGGVGGAGGPGIVRLFWIL